MDELLMEKIDQLIMGKLDPDEEVQLLDLIDSDAALKEHYIAAKAVNAAMEMEIASDLRAYLAGTDVISQVTLKEKPRLIPLFLIGTAATILILILATTTAYYSLSDASIANNYKIASVAVRGAVEQQDVYFNEAVSAFYKDDYENAISSLALIENEEGIINEEKEWLTALIYLKSTGSKSQEFKTSLDQILTNENHEYYKQAERLQGELSSFWKKLVFSK